jgi:membrane fusion protein, multidrug efflux system
MKSIFVISALTFLLACNHKESPETTPLPSIKVKLAPENPGREAGWIAATLNATERATLSTRMAASVRKVYVNEGQRVGAGALLVSLSDEDLQGGLKAAEAAMAAASAQFQRIENLAKQNAATPAEMDQARTQLAQAQAGRAQVRANLAYTQIRAPFAGVVQARRVNEGDFVGPGMPLVELEGQGVLELVGSVSESEAKGLKIGQKLPFEAEGQKGLAAITGLSTGGDPVSHRGTLRARIQKTGNLRTGSFARIQLPVRGEASQDLFVPGSALVNRGELTGAFIAKNGKAELRWLSLGEAQDGRFPVRAGLSKGESIIDQPGGLRDGQAIEVATNKE